MAMANTGYLLAQKNGEKKNRVLLMDWDLEAPGLHRFFHDNLSNRKELQSQDTRQTPGIIELFEDFQSKIEDIENPFEYPDREQWESLWDSIDFDKYILKTNIPNLHMVKAGAYNDGYAGRVHSFDWQKLFDQAPWLFAVFSEQLSKQYDYVLIDSRTGVSDVSGICTALLPEKLVLVFTPNRQSLRGVLQIGKDAVSYRFDSDDLRDLKIYPVVSRVDFSEKELDHKWRVGNTEEKILGYKPAFESLLSELYSLDECDLNVYFYRVFFEHEPFYSYGENIAGLVEMSEKRAGLAASYRSFASLISSTGNPWEIDKEEESRFVSLDKKETEDVQENYENAGWFLFSTLVFLAVLFLGIGQFVDMFSDRYYYLIGITVWMGLGILNKEKRKTHGSVMGTLFNRPSVFSIDHSTSIIYYPRKFFESILNSFVNDFIGSIQENILVWKKSNQSFRNNLTEGSSWIVYSYTIYSILFVGSVWGISIILANMLQAMGYLAEVPLALANFEYSVWFGSLSSVFVGGFVAFDLLRKDEMSDEQDTAENNAWNNFLKISSILLILSGFVVIVFLSYFNLSVKGNISEVVLQQFELYSEIIVLVLVPLNTSFSAFLIFRKGFQGLVVSAILVIYLVLSLFQMLVYVLRVVGVFSIFLLDLFYRLIYMVISTMIFYIFSTLEFIQYRFIQGQES